MRVVDGKCIMNMVDGLSVVVKAIDVCDATHLLIDTVDGSFPMTLWVLESTIQKSGVTIIGSLIALAS